MDQVDAAIIGFGAASKPLALDLADAGLTVAVIERSTRMYGGACVNTACLPSKMLVHAAAVSAFEGGEFPARAERYEAATRERFFDTEYDYIADCIDLVSCKVDLIRTAHARGHDGRLRLADRGVQRAALAVEVTLADGVLVHERERADAGAGQRLGAPAAHAAEAEHGDAAAAQARERGLAEEHLRADVLLGHRASSRSKVTTKSVPS